MADETARRRSALTVTVRIRAKAGMEERVRRELAELLAPTRAEPGCINFDLHVSEGDPAQFLVHENWTSEADLSRHFEMPYIRRWLEVSRDLLAEPMALDRWIPEDRAG